MRWIYVDSPLNHRCPIWCVDGVARRFLSRFAGFENVTRKQVGDPVAGRLPPPFQESAEALTDGRLHP